MKPDREDETLKALYCEMRREDERRAPSFERVWQAAAARRKKAIPRAVWGIAAAAALVLLLGAAGALLFGPWGRPAVSPAPPIVQTHTPALPLPTEPWISTWESPTAFLLEPPVASSTAAGSVQGPVRRDLVIWPGEDNRNS
jgi:hypothetical protein